METNIKNKDIEITSNLEGDIIITNKRVHSGFAFSLKEVETCDLKYLKYKLYEELNKRGDL